VLQIGGAYIAGAWLGAEIFNFLFQQFQAPDWSYRLLAIVFVVGFPISMVLAWVIQVNEEGEWEIDPSRGDTRTLAVAIAIGVLITAGLSWLILPQREPPPVYEPIPTSLAVLPFTDPEGTPHDRSAAEGLYLALVEGLEQSAELTLVRLGRVERPEDLAEFGESLGVAALAWGQLRKTANASHLDLELLDIVTAEITWSETFEWDATRTPELANRMANGLLQAMALPPLAGREFAGTDNSEAYRAFLDGERKARNWERGSLADATEDFQRAIDLDPSYTLAYTGLAQALYDLLELDENLADTEREQLEQRARKAANIAQKLDPDSADALSLLAYQLDNRQLRIQAWERALELDPGHAPSYFRYGRELADADQLEDAERLLLRAVALSPQNARYRLELARVFSLQGREDEAQAEREKAEQLRL
jgi:tetratricopeptide (TPR) repeat protein